MIKEIAEEYFEKYEESILELLNNIKCLDAEIVGLSPNFLKYKNENEKIEIEIYFIDKEIAQIAIWYIDNGVMSYLAQITQRLNTEKTKTVIEELYNKYFGGAK